MGTTRYYTAASLDGFIADESNSLEWLFEVPGSDEAAGARFDRFFADVGAMAMGATTYRWVIEHEALLEHPERWSAFYGDRPCWVFSHGEVPIVPDAQLYVVQGPVGPIHRVMTAAAGRRDIWLVGGGDLVGQFADEGLLDRIHVAVAPVTLGAGAPLLPRRLPASWLHLANVEHDGHFVFLDYDVSGEG